MDLIYQEMMWDAGVIGFILGITLTLSLFGAIAFFKVMQSKKEKYKKRSD